VGIEAPVFVAVPLIAILLQVVDRWSEVMYQHLLALQQHIFLIFTFELEGRGSGSNYWPYWMALCLVFLTAANVPHQYIL
jgi:hypothetical protein